MREHEFLPTEKTCVGPQRISDSAAVIFLILIRGLNFFRGEEPWVPRIIGHCVRSDNKLQRPTNGQKSKCRQCTPA